MAYVVAGVTYDTKEALREQARKYLHDADTPIHLAGDPAYAFYADLLMQTNPRYALRGGGIYAFVCALTDYGNHCMEIERVRRKRGRRERFSYEDCIKSLGHSRQENIARKIRENRLSAYRYAVDDQIRDFRMLDHHGACQMCFAYLPDFDESHVDHIILFQHLVSRFEEGISLDRLPTKFDRISLAGDDREGYITRFKSEDLALVQAWRKFHAKESQLRLVCKACNESRTYGAPEDTEGMVPYVWEGWGITYNYFTAFLHISDYETLVRLLYHTPISMSQWGARFVADVYANMSEDWWEGLSKKQKAVLKRMVLHIVNNPAAGIRRPGTSECSLIVVSSESDYDYGYGNTLDEETDE